MTKLEEYTNLMTLLDVKEGRIRRLEEVVLEIQDGLASRVDYFTEEINNYYDKNLDLDNPEDEDAAFENFINITSIEEVEFIKGLVDETVYEKIGIIIR